MSKFNNAVLQSLALLGWLLVTSPVTAAEFWVVQVSFDANGTEIQQVQRLQLAEGQRRGHRPTAVGDVRVSLTSANGEVLHQLSIEDPRILRVPMLPGKAQAHQFVLRDEGEFTLLLPATEHAQHLELQWPTTPGQQLQNESASQQLSLQPFAQQLQLQ